MTRRFFYLCAGSLCLALAYHFGATSGIGDVAKASDLTSADEPRPGKLRFPVTWASDLEGKPFEIIGRVYTRKMGLTTFSRPSEESLLPRLMGPAKKLGADAIVGVHSGTLGVDGG